MITTFYICDKCGSEQESSDQFWKVSVMADKAALSPDWKYTHKSMHVCRQCLEALGIFPSKETKEDPAYSPPTIEELIVEIVRKEAE